MRSRYSFLREAFGRLANEFVELEAVPLFHDLVWGPDCEDWSEEEYAAFVAENCQSDVGGWWEEWQLWPSRAGCSRFYGFNNPSREFFRQFQHMACRGYRILVEFRDCCSDTPDGFRSSAVDVDYTGEYQFGWLKLLHEWAYRFPTGFLSGRCTWWGSNEMEIDIDAIASKTTKSIRSGAIYHCHPIANVTEQNVFSASWAFIHFCLAPDQMLDLGRHDGKPELNLPCEAVRPYWSSVAGSHGELWFDNQLVKKFDKPSESQQVVLDAFQRAGWPKEIENPFKRRADIEAHNATDCLRNTIESLNERHLCDGKIRFHTKDNREYATWK
jgi:hypothetical protein